MTVTKGDVKVGFDRAHEQFRAATKNKRVELAKIQDPDLKAFAEDVARLEQGGDASRDTFEACLSTTLKGRSAKRGPLASNLSTALTMAAAELAAADGRAGCARDGKLEMGEMKTVPAMSARMLLFSMVIVHSSSGVHDPNLTLADRMKAMVEGRSLGGHAHADGAHHAAPTTSVPAIHDHSTCAPGECDAAAPTLAAPHDHATHDHGDHDHG